MNGILFAFSPYLALVLLVTVPLARLATPGALSRLPSIRRDARLLYRGTPAWRIGVGLILLGHLLGLTMPNQRALWRFLPGGPMAFQAVAFGLGLLALAGCASLVRERFRPTEFHQATLLGSAVDSLFLTLLALGIGSGMVMTFAYHLGSAWYSVTLVPYLRSLARLAPDVALVADLPPVVKLHLLSAIAMVAVLPFTALGSVLVWPLVALKRTAAGLAARRADAAS
jgi:nitrate reductase gamma subunit